MEGSIDVFLAGLGLTGGKEAADAAKAVPSLGGAAKTFFEVLGRQKDMASGMYESAQFTSAATSGKSLRSEDWAHLGNGVLSPASGVTSTAILAGVTAPAVVTAATTFTVGGLVTRSIETALTHNALSTTRDGLNSTTAPLDANRQRLAGEVTAAKNKLAQLEEQKIRLQQARDRAGKQ